MNQQYLVTRRKDRLDPISRVVPKDTCVSRVLLAKRRVQGTNLGVSLMDNPRPVTYTLTDFLQWRENGSLQISPKFQRRGVWTPKQRSYFIDTILREMPSHPIYLRNVYDLDTRKVRHEVVDGQQRLRSVLDFYDGKYAISTNLNTPYKGHRFSKLPKDRQLAIMKYEFTCETFEAITDQEVYEVFRRMNSFSSPLTKQELRHGRFFGYFSQACEGLAMEHLEFWRSNKIVSERNIARMLEVQFTSSLLIQQIDGLQNLNDSIDEFYDQYDDAFPHKAEHEKRFRATIDQVTETFGDTLTETVFRKPAFFYTLFGTIFHRTFGMPKAQQKTLKRPLTISERDDLRNAVSKLSDVVIAAREQQRLTRKPEDPVRPSKYPSRFEEFVVASLSQTDSIAPRQVRFATLYKEAFG